MRYRMTQRPSIKSILLTAANRAIARGNSSDRTRKFERAHAKICSEMSTSTIRRVRLVSMTRTVTASQSVPLARSSGNALFQTSAIAIVTERLYEPEIFVPSAHADRQATARVGGEKRPGDRSSPWSVKPGCRESSWVELLMGRVNRVRVDGYRGEVRVG